MESMAGEAWPGVIVSQVDLLPPSVQHPIVSLSTEGCLLVQSLLCTQSPAQACAGLLRTTSRCSRFLGGKSPAQFGHSITSRAEKQQHSGQFISQAAEQSNGTPFWDVNGLLMSLMSDFSPHRKGNL